MLSYYKFRLKKGNNLNTLNIIHFFRKIKRLFSLFSKKNEGRFFMNTEKNQKIWIEKVHKNLLLRGRSEKTFIKIFKIL